MENRYGIALPVSDELIEKALGHGPGTNCLEGVRCPKCFSTGEFAINDATWDADGHFEARKFDSGDPIRCLACQHTAARAATFAEPTITHKHIDAAGDYLEWLGTEYTVNNFTDRAPIYRLAWLIAKLQAQGIVDRLTELLNRV